MPVRDWPTAYGIKLRARDAPRRAAVRAGAETSLLLVNAGRACGTDGRGERSKHFG